MPEAQTTAVAERRNSTRPEAGQPRKLLTIDEVADQLNTSRYTIHRLRAAGRFPPPVKIGSCARWTQSDVDGFIAASRCGAGNSGIKKRKPGPKRKAAEVRQ